MTDLRDWVLDRPEITIPAAVVLAMAAAVLLHRIGARRIAVTVASLIGLGASLESSWRFAGDTLGWHGIWQPIPGALFESAVISTAARIVEEDRRGDDGDPTPHVRRFWALVAAASITMAASSHTLGETIGRGLIPVVGAAVWYGDRACRRAPREASEAGSWLWTPRRLGVRLGLIAPGDQDVTAVHREHRTRQLVTAARRLEQAGPRTRSRRAARLDRLALGADDAMAMEVELRIRRARNLVARFTPALAVADDTTPDTVADPAGDTVHTTAPDRVDTVADATAAAVLRAVVDTAPAAVMPAVAPITTPDPALAVADDTTPDTVADTAGDTTPVRLTDAARKIAAARRRRPEATQDDIAQRTRIHVRTVQRWWPHTTPDPTPVGTSA